VASPPAHLREDPPATSEPFLPYGRQSIDDADVDAVAAALRDPLITQGPKVDAFEAAFAEHVGARHAVAFSSGTAGLHGAAVVAGVGPGTELLTSPLTFAADATCALYAGGRPRFVDVDPATWNLDAAAAVRAVDERTRAIIAVSLTGLPADLDGLAPVRDDVVVIEDGCHALGGHRDGRPVGGPGGADMTVFSLHPVKAMTTGEGGVVTTEDDELAERLRRFRTHGIVRDGSGATPTDGPWFYDVRDLGFNYRITDVQCALGLSQLTRLEGWIERRNEIAERYRELLAGEERIALPPAAPAGSRHGYHLFVVRVLAGAERRREVFEALRAAGIGVQVHYVPIYRFSLYRELGYAQDTCPAVEDYYAGAISLPMFPGLTDADVRRVVGTLQRVL
jgi:perosamine synthetase